MERQEHHHMVLKANHPSGEEEWYCYACGRRLLIRWEPEFQRTVLEPGDESAAHSGGKGGLQLGPLQIDGAQAPAARDEAHLSDDDPTLRPWSKWLDDADFESRWHDD